MGTTQPIRETAELQKFMNYYEKEHPSTRNYAMVILGLHTALRISDILTLHWNDVYDFEKNAYKKHLCIQEKKTGKTSIIALNKHVTIALTKLKKERANARPNDYIFTKNTDYTSPLSRSQAFRIIKRAGLDSLHEEHVSCHSLRKTFGYHAWKQGVPPALLMDIYNHSSYQITKRYLGIEQDERDAIFMHMNF